MSGPVIAVIGSGAVGAYYGGRLAQHGHDVHFLLRSDYQAVRENGWRIKSCDGDFDLPAGMIKVHDDAGKMPKADLVIVTLKTTANDQYEKLISPVVKNDTMILTLQNGLGNEDGLAELFGAERVMGGMAFVCINRISPGVVHHIAQGLIKIGEFAGPPTDRLRAVREMFLKSGVRCEVLENLMYGRWEKLVWNIPFNGLSALLDQTTDLLIGSAAGVELIKQIMSEVIAAARGAGIALPEELIGIKIEETKVMGDYKTSMQLDMQAGRAMEVEAIFGFPCKMAVRCGVAAPSLGMLYRMLTLRNDLIMRGV